MQHWIRSCYQKSDCRIIEFLSPFLFINSFNHNTYPYPFNLSRRFKSLLMQYFYRIYPTTVTVPNRTVPNRTAPHRTVIFQKYQDF